MVTAVGCRVDKEVITELVIGICHALPSDVSRKAVRESLLHLVGQILTPADLRTVAWRLAGNVDQLREARPVLPWDMTHELEWVPMQITDAKRWGISTKRGPSYGVSFKLRALAGLPCPNLFEVFWSHRACAILAARLGFDLRDPDKTYGYANPFQMVGCKFYARFTPRPQNKFSPFDEVARASESPTILTWNRRLTASRHPANRKCPRNFPTTQPCFRCSAGLESCPIALHSRDYVSRTCPRCSEKKWFDPGHPSDVCIECSFRKNLPEREKTPAANPATS